MSDPYETRSPTLERRPETRYTREGTGARAPHDGGGRRRRGILLPLLLGLFALAIGAAILLSLLGGDDDGSARQSQQSQQAAPAGPQAGELTAGATGVIPGAAAGLGGTVGQTAQGREVVVQSVVQNAEDPQALEGFWVGSSAQDRVYVEYGGDVGADEATFQPQVGQKVDLEGPVKAAPQEAARVLNLSPEDARLVQQQGAYVNADRVTPAE